MYPTDSGRPQKLSRSAPATAPVRPALAPPCPRDAPALLLLRSRGVGHAKATARASTAPRPRFRPLAPGPGTAAGGVPPWLRDVGGWNRSTNS